MTTFAFEQFQIQPISERDGWRLCDFVSANADYLKRYFPITVAANLNPELSNLFVLEKLADFASGKEYVFTLKEREERKIIGLVYVKEIDTTKREAEIAYCIGYPYKNKGIATKSINRISNWALTELGLKQLRIIVHESNLPSIKVAQKCGYLWKQTLKEEHKPPNEAPLDMELYVLEDEG
jgi:ribosomal-protein-alanine N-acetyltransferase